MENSKLTDVLICPICENLPVSVFDGGNPAKGYKWRIYCGSHSFLRVKGYGNTREVSNEAGIMAWNEAVNTLIDYKNDEQYIARPDTLGNLLHIAMNAIGGKSATSLIRSGSSYEAATAGGYTVDGYLAIQDLGKLPNALEESESGNHKGFEVLVWGGDINAEGWAGDVDISELKHFPTEYDAVMWLALRHTEQLIYRAVEVVTHSSLGEGWVNDGN
jgi:hypothetical protein